MELKFTEYWPWYRQRLWRTWHTETLLSAAHVKHIDRLADFHESMGFYSHLVRPRTCAIGAELITHLPHHTHGVWCMGISDKGHLVKSPPQDSMQETWCEQQFGERDREWLYVGNASWTFRLKEQAVQFELTWR